MMGNSLLLALRNFRGADVEIAIELRGIADYNFAAKLLGDAHGQRGFARGGGAEDGDEWWRGSNR